MVMWFLVAITILVAIHEFGHFYVARLCGVKVLRFSIGFGKRIWTRTDRQGTEFAVSAIPLGGYVKMLDEREGDIPEEELPYAFNRKSPWQRIAIAFAGPLANFLLAIVAYWIVFLQGSTVVAPVIGKVEPGSLAYTAGLEYGQEIISVDDVETPSRKDVRIRLLERLGESGEIRFVVRYWDESESGQTGGLTYESIVQIEDWMRGVEEPDLLAGLGFEFYKPPYLSTISAVSEGGAASKAGMQGGDKLLYLDNTPVSEKFDWVEYINNSVGKNIVFVVEREGKELELLIKPEPVTLSSGKVVGRIGVSVSSQAFPKSMVKVKEHGVLGAVNEALIESWNTSGIILLSLKKLILGEISAKNLSGPIGIAKVAADHAKHGVFAFLDFLAYLSLMLGVLNLLPVPVLDGGHILFNLIEWARGAPLSEKIQNMGYQVGMVLIFGLMILAFYNDILRL